MFKTFTIQKDLFDTRVISMPLQSLLRDKKDNNYNEIKKAFESLRQKSIVYELTDENNMPMTYHCGIINSFIISKYSGVCSFQISPLIWEVIFNFSRGYRKIEIEMAMSFKSVYTMRIYELISGKTESITYNIEDLKKMFSLEDKYKQVSDFVKRVIKIAKEELDEKSYISFVYQVNKDGKNHKSITFTPIKISKNMDNDLKTKSVSIHWSLERPEIHYLENNFGFTIKEISSNINVFKKYKDNNDLLVFLGKIKRKALSVENPKGYVINALKKELNVV
jgi:plasmid replication initiation protein